MDVKKTSNTQVATEYTNLNELQKSVGSLATMTEDKIAIVSERMVEMDRATLAVGGRSQTQTTNQLMTLTMMTDSPYRSLRQCLANIDKKRGALDEAYFAMLEKKVAIAEGYKEGSELSVIIAHKYEHEIIRSKNLIDGAFKDIALFQAAYEEIRESHQIPENWDEMDAEKAEINHHIKQAFKQSVRQMVSTGTIDVGNMEYLEQFGVHPQTAIKIIRDYIKTEEKEIAGGKAPTVTRLYNFLDSMVEMFHGAHELVLDRIGIKELIKTDFLYLEDKDDDNL